MLKNIYLTHPQYFHAEHLLLDGFGADEDDASDVVGGAVARLCAVAYGFHLHLALHFRQIFGRL